jgi:Holliday junction DNA helicase RuvA
MIGRLTGKIIELTPPSLILDIQGVGYQVHMPTSSFKGLAAGQELTLFTKYIIKEEEAFIYGFIAKEDKATFEQLISVPGIGPKSALTLLSNFKPQEIARAIEDENISLLASVPKIGQKLASKIVLELKGKLEFTKEASTFSQAVSALVGLGLTRVEAINRLRQLPDSQNLSVEEMIKLALKNQPAQ